MDKCPACSQPVKPVDLVCPVCGFLLEEDSPDTKPSKKWWLKNYAMKRFGGSSKFARFTIFATTVVFLIHTISTFINYLNLTETLKSPANQQQLNDLKTSLIIFLVWRLILLFFFVKIFLKSKKKPYKNSLVCFWLLIFTYILEWMFSINLVRGIHFLIIFILLIMLFINIRKLRHYKMHEKASNKEEEKKKS